MRGIFDARFYRQAPVKSQFTSITFPRFLESYLDFECEVLFQVFDDHDEKWKLDSQRFLWI